MKLKYGLFNDFLFGFFGNFIAPANITHSTECYMKIKTLL